MSPDTNTKSETQNHSKYRLWRSARGRPHAGCILGTWAHPGHILGISQHPGRILGACWHPGHPGHMFGASRAHAGRILGTLGTSCTWVVDASWACWATMGATWAHPGHPGAYWAHSGRTPGACWPHPGHPGAPWAHLGRTLGTCWPHPGPPGAPWAHPGHILGRPPMRLSRTRTAQHNEPTFRIPEIGRAHV